MGIDNCKVVHVDDCICGHPDVMHTLNIVNSDLPILHDEYYTCQGCIAESPNIIQWCLKNSADRWCGFSMAGGRYENQLLKTAAPQYPKLIPEMRQATLMEAVSQ